MEFQNRQRLCLHCFRRPTRRSTRLECETESASPSRHQGDKLFAMPRVFVSYVRENLKIVERLATILRAHGVDVWLDRESLKPGQRWADEIRRGINSGDYFLACFSEEYASRSRTYMNEELTLAIDELRQRPSNRSWFLPVLLSDFTAVPDRNIGGGETLASIQYVSLQDDWDEGIRKLLEVIQPNAALLHAALADLSNASKRKKIAAAGVLGSMEGSAIVAVPQLLSLLKDENDTVVAASAEALGKICGGSAVRNSPEVKEVVSKLLETMRTAEVYYSSRHAARALYCLGTEGMRALLEAQAFKGYAVAGDARQLIVHNGDRSAPALAELAATDPEVSSLAKQLLSEINDWKEHMSPATCAEPGTLPV